jgi:hypothetical protein
MGDAPQPQPNCRSLGIRGSCGFLRVVPPVAPPATAWRRAGSVSPGPSSTRRRSASARTWWSGRFAVFIKHSSSVLIGRGPTTTGVSRGPTLKLLNRNTLFSIPIPESIYPLVSHRALSVRRLFRRRQERSSPASCKDRTAALIACSTSFSDTAASRRGGVNVHQFRFFFAKPGPTPPWGAKPSRIMRQLIHFFEARKFPCHSAMSDFAGAVAASFVRLAAGTCENRAAAPFWSAKEY